jgi:hypothetical protein
MHELRLHQRLQLEQQEVQLPYPSQTNAKDRAFLWTAHPGGNRTGCPTFAKAYVGRKRWATRISCHGAPPTSACAAFIKESRMEFAIANKAYRKSEGSPTIAFTELLTKSIGSFDGTGPKRHRKGRNRDESRRDG